MLSAALHKAIQYKPHIKDWFIILLSLVFFLHPSLKGIPFLRICSVLGASGDWLGLQNVNIAREEKKLDFSSDSIKYIEVHWHPNT